jgi:hypothetical protein
MEKPGQFLLIDIDGLRPDVFEKALKDEMIPNLAKLVGGKDLSQGLRLPAVAPAPSITFASQASLFTGTHPKDHGIPGNQFFDRFGTFNQGVPKHYAFDVGDTLSADDAVMVFTHGLASQCLRVPTIYEKFLEQGWKSVVAGNMYASGADVWIKPSLLDIARFTKGSNLFGLSSEEYDREIVEETIAYIDKHGFPKLLTIYLMGVDHESHLHGPQAQLRHLTQVIDPMIGELWQVVSQSLDGAKMPLVAIFSDHGQIQVIPDDKHSLRLAFPFEREMGHLFDALGLDVHDYPGEDPDCDAVVASNGGLAHVYLQNRTGHWKDVPDFERDVLPVARAFWEAHHTGNYASELKGALSGVLVRDVEAEGWHAKYQAATPGGELRSLEEWFSQGMGREYIDPVNRLNNLAGPMAGDLLLVSNYRDGYYFAQPIPGMHGGLHPDDSKSTFIFGWPDATQDDWLKIKSKIEGAIQKRCRDEGERQPSTADLITGLTAVI